MSRIIPLITLILLALAGTVTANESEDDVAVEAPATDSGEAPEQDEAQSAEAEEEDGADTVNPLELLGKTVQPGTFETLHWAPDQSFRSIATPVPVLVAHGNEPGPRLCLTAAVHGDELNGIEMVRRLMYELEPAELAGTVVGVPIVSLDGFRNGSRYLSDRRDLNRYFPGHEKGSAAKPRGLLPVQQHRAPVRLPGGPAHRLAETDQPAATARRPGQARSGGLRQALRRHDRAAQPAR